MRHARIFLAAFVILAAAWTWAEPSVTLALESTRNGQTIPGGTLVDWTIKVSASTSDNLGLALILCDLVQDSTNPVLFDLPPGNADSINTTMDDFSRPLGVANPGEGGATTGYIGVQRGLAGQKNLIQIGGAQNTFGFAGPPGLGQDIDVNAGVGQGSSPEVVLSGSFPAPATPGTYTFCVANARANVLTAVNGPPAFSPVVSAAVNLSGASFGFVVGSTQGDLNCDGVVNFDDINPFVLALSDPGAYQQQYPNCNILNADCNGDGVVDFDDINPFVAILSGAR